MGMGNPDLPDAASITHLLTHSLTDLLTHSLTYSLYMSLYISLSIYLSLGNGNGNGNGMWKDLSDIWKWRGGEVPPGWLSLGSRDRRVFKAVPRQETRHFHGAEEPLRAIKSC